MGDHKVYSSIVDAMILPRIIQLDKNLFAAAFFLMKLLPARLMLDRAQDAGLLEPGSFVIETTSGTLGLALALLCKIRGYHLILVSDPVVDPPLQRRLEDLGARVEIVREPAPQGGFQQARLNLLAELRSAHPGSFCPSQYDNPHNPESYAVLAELLAKTIGEIHCLVGGVGSGGSICGTTTYLRRFFPSVEAVGVDTHGSVLFGQPDQKRLLRGLGNSLMPKNLKHSIFDEVHWVKATEAFTSARVLYRNLGLYMGPTSGATYLVARWRAQKNPDSTVVVLFADEGYRYQDLVYNDKWLPEDEASLPAEPQLVEHPLQAGSFWSCMHWGRRTYDEVLGSPFEMGRQNHK